MHCPAFAWPATAPNSPFKLHTCCTVHLGCCRTCAEAVEAAGGVVRLEEGGMATAAASLPPAADVTAACQFMRLPIRFESLQAEVRGWAAGWVHWEAAVLSQLTVQT